LADTMCRPGQLNFLNRYGWFGSDRNVLIGPICASTNTAMITPYGAYARTTSDGLSGLATRPANSGVGSSTAPPATTCGVLTGTGRRRGCRRTTATVAAALNSAATMSASGIEM